MFVLNVTFINGDHVLINTHSPTRLNRFLDLIAKELDVAQWTVHSHQDITADIRNTTSSTCVAR